MRDSLFLTSQDNDYPMNKKNIHTPNNSTPSRDDRKPQPAAAAPAPAAPHPEPDEYSATPEEVEAFLRDRRLQKEQQKQNADSRNEMLQDELPQGSLPDNTPDPYFEADPHVPQVPYNENPFLWRGCRGPVASYEQVSKAERCSCSKLAVHDWMAGIKSPCADPFDCVEVRFKNNRKDFYRLPYGINVVEGDMVAVDGAPGHDVGIVSLTGELCRMQMKKKKVDPAGDSIKKLFRRAKASDLERWVEAVKLEESTLVRVRQITEEQGLVMKMNDVEYQGDRSKAIFYYTADDRVDFRTLIRVLAEEFHVRVEMKQIGVRQESSKVGGLGTCGRELCCSTWLSNFKSVTTSVAKAQQILPNPQKLAGQCGKLKCCLNFEYEVYADAMKKLPPQHVALRFKKGLALHKKTDVFRGIMWYAYEGESDLYALPGDRVKEIIEMNRNREYPEKLELYQVELMSSSALIGEANDSDFEQALSQMADHGNEVITDDKPKQRGDRRDKGERNNRRGDRGDDRNRQPRNNADARRGNPRDGGNPRREDRREDRNRQPRRQGDDSIAPRSRQDRGDRNNRRGNPPQNNRKPQQHKPQE